MHHWPFGPARWESAVPDWEHRLLSRLPGPVLDVGCGPGRHVAALAAAGTPGLGIDTSRRAVSSVRRAGHRALHSSVWNELPGHGRWGAALLLDENLGLGADPVRLLRRVTGLLHTAGRIVVEAIPGISGVKVVDVGEPWALVGPDAVGALARQASLDLERVIRRDSRHLAVLTARV